VRHHPSAAQGQVEHRPARAPQQGAVEVDEDGSHGGEANGWATKTPGTQRRDRRGGWRSLRFRPAWEQRGGFLIPAVAHHCGRFGAICQAATADSWYLHKRWRFDTCRHWSVWPSTAASPPPPRRSGPSSRTSPPTSPGSSGSWAPPSSTARPAGSPRRARSWSPGPAGCWSRWWRSSPMSRRCARRWWASSGSG